MSTADAPPESMICRLQKVPDDGEFLEPRVYVCLLPSEGEDDS